MMTACEKRPGKVHWRLAEVMARHKVLAKDLAGELGLSDNAISIWRKSETMPRITGDRLSQICNAINRLSKIRECVTPGDLLELVPDDE